MSATRTSPVMVATSSVASCWEISTPAARCRLLMSWIWEARVSVIAWRRPGRRVGFQKQLRHRQVPRPVDGQGIQDDGGEAFGQGRPVQRGEGGLPQIVEVLLTRPFHHAQQQRVAGAEVARRGAGRLAGRGVHGPMGQAAGTMTGKDFHGRVGQAVAARGVGRWHQRCPHHFRRAAVTSASSTRSAAQAT